jgi:hypothetical protein
VAGFFAFTYPGYSQDEDAGLRDVVRYASEGVTTTTLREHVNAAGPLTFVVMAIAGEATGNLHLGSRLVSLVCAIASFLLIFSIVRRAGGTSTSAAIAGALLFVSPYAPLSMGSMLTESFSIAVLLLGVLLWCKAVGPGGIANWRGWIWAAGVTLGLAATARQYYLAVILSVWIATCWLELRSGSFAPSSARIAAVARIATFGLVLVAPIAVVFLIWGGLTPPLLRSGVSHPGWDAGVGLQMYRPLSALMLCGLYALPVAVLLLDSDMLRRRVLLATGLTSVVLVLVLDTQRLFCDSSVQITCGPADGLFRAASAIGLGAVTGAVLLWLAMLAITIIARSLLSRFDMLHPVQILASIALILFIAEQVFVGGNIPFYDRYVQQVWPLVVLTVGVVQLQRRFEWLALTSLPYVVYGNWRVLRLLVG